MREFDQSITKPVVVDGTFDDVLKFSNMLRAVQNEQAREIRLGGDRRSDGCQQINIPAWLATLTGEYGADVNVPFVVGENAEQPGRRLDRRVSLVLGAFAPSDALVDQSTW